MIPCTDPAISLYRYHRFSFMTPCEADKHRNWNFTTGDTEAKFTFHDLTGTDECAQLLCTTTLRLLMNCLQMSTLAFVGSVTT